MVLQVVSVPFSCVLQAVALLAQYAVNSHSLLLIYY
jgi:hypothetical protein